MSKTMAAQRGAELLDLVRPGWYMQVQPGKLDLGNRQRCVLGQLYGDYILGVLAIQPSVDAIAYGFDLSLSITWLWPGAKERSFSQLTDAWRTEIANRRLHVLAKNTKSEEVLA